MQTLRLDRQLRIEGWNQQALENATIGIVGDNDLLASLFVVAAAALGLNHAVILAPRLDNSLIDMAQKLNPYFSPIHVVGLCSHPVMADLFHDCELIVDLCRYGLGNKLLLNMGFERGVPIVRGFCSMASGTSELRVFSYLRGREWMELHELVSANSLPDSHEDDPVLDMLGAGIVLEEVKNLLMGRPTSDEVIGYRSAAYDPGHRQPRILVVGAGALGIFTGLGLAYSGFKQVTFIDPDVIELTNLNRQVLFYDAIGRIKSETLSGRLNRLFNLDTVSQIGYFNRRTPIASYDVIFDCMDNHESRIVLSERCREEGKVLVSGGTSAHAGQAVFYDPATGARTPAELLGLYDIVAKRQDTGRSRNRASCVYQPDPSVVMTNMIIAAVMVDACRTFLGGGEPENIFYDSAGRKRFS